MAEQRFYWLKLMSDFFSQPKIKKLRRIAGGDTYTVIYLKLQLASLQNGGVLCFEGIEDNFAEEMALTLDESIENVQATLIYLESQGLIERVSEAEYCLTETQRLIGSEGSSAIRMRKKREAQKALSSQCDTGVLLSDTKVQNRYGDIDIDIEKDIDIDTDTDIYIGGADAAAVYIEPVENVDKLQQAINDFLEFRKEIKKPLGKKGIAWLNQRLDELAKNEDEKVSILNQSILNGWKDVFPLREINDKVPASGSGRGTKYQYGNTRFSNYQPSEHDFDEIERLEREQRLRDAEADNGRVLDLP